MRVPLVVVYLLVVVRLSITNLCIKARRLWDWDSRTPLSCRRRHSRLCRHLTMDTRKLGAQAQPRQQCTTTTTTPPPPPTRKPRDRGSAHSTLARHTLCSRRRRITRT